MSDMSNPGGRSGRLEAVLHELLRQSPELDAAAVVSFDGLPMASALPTGMDEDRVAAMSAALLSLGERAAAGLGRGDLNQVYIEGEHGTVFLVSADGEAVLVAVASPAAKAGLVLFELRRTAAAVAGLLAEPPAIPEPAPEPTRVTPEPAVAWEEPVAPAVPMQAASPVEISELSLEPAYVAATQAMYARSAELADPYAPTPAAEQLASWTSYATGDLTGAGPAAGPSWA